MFYEDGHYECRFNQEGKFVWKNVGEDAAIAQAEQLHLGRVLTARVAAGEAGTEIVETPGRVQLRTKAKEYKERQIARGKKRAAVTFGTAIEEFLPSVKVQFADELTEAVINRWSKRSANAGTCTSSAPRTQRICSERESTRAQSCSTRAIPT